MCFHSDFHVSSHITLHRAHFFFEEHPIAKARAVAREFNTGDKRGDVFTGTPGLIAMRRVISRAMTKCEKGARRSIMLADVKSAFLHGDARRSLHVELHPDDHTSVSLNAPCMELATPR